MPSSSRPSTARLFTFASGGWVLLIAGLVTIALIAWAVMPALVNVWQRPPGDGRTIESYGFDLSTLSVPRETLVPVMLHRDMVPVLTDPPIITAAEATRLTEEERGKFLVSTDRVIGVVINGEARAYPIQLITVHEVVNDALGGVPIAVTYSWLGDAPRVFDRRVDDQTVELGVSGLVANAGTLLYDRRPPAEGEPFVEWHERGESLWRQFDGLAVSGPAAENNLTLAPINAQLVSWRQWQQMHPETTVLARDPMLLKRYRRSSPDQYFRSADIPYPVKPLPERDLRVRVGNVDMPLPGWKDRMIVLTSEGVARVYPFHVIAAMAMRQDNGHADDPRTWHDSIAGRGVAFTYDPRAETVAVDVENGVAFIHCFWFLWYANHPETATDNLVWDVGEDV
jgi:hypothetical protein